jgi:hypothetical protein
MSQTMVMSSGQRQAGVPQHMAPSGTSRLERWLGNPTESGKIVQITPQMIQSMSPQELMKIARNNIAIWGQEGYDEFVSQITGSHMLRKPKAFTPLLLPKVPYLGSVKLGEVILAKKDGKYLLNQIFTSNFVADIDTSGKGDLFNLHDKGPGNSAKMFYGMHVVVDRQGNPLGFDRSRGKNGVSFQTTKRAEAAVQIESAATGLNIDMLRERFAARR